MRFAAHRNQGTYAAAYQPRISTVDGQATFFEIDRQDMRIHELFRGYSLHRDYNYRPELPEHLRWQLVEPSPGNQKTTSTIARPLMWTISRNGRGFTTNAVGPEIESCGATKSQTMKNYGHQKTSRTSPTLYRRRSLCPSVTDWRKPSLGRVASEMKLGCWSWMTW